MPKTCGECPHVAYCGLALHIDECGLINYKSDEQDECPARTSQRQSEAALRVAREALEDSINTIKAWHDMAECGVGNEPSEAWKLYYEHSPEIKRTRNAIIKINPLLGNPEVDNGG